jgi:hypothetical protein
MSDNHTMDSKQFQFFEDKFDKTIRLLTILALKGVEREDEKIELLDMMGFRQSEIARLLNKSPQNVNVVLTRLRKKKESSAGKTEAAPSPGIESIQGQPAGGS